MITLSHSLGSATLTICHCNATCPPLGAHFMTQAQLSAMASRHPSHRAPFLLSRVAAGVALRLTGRPDTECSPVDRQDVAPGVALSLAHEDSVAAAVASTNTDVAVDVVDTRRLGTLLARRPQFRQRWTPCARPTPDDVALHWGLREACVKLTGHNRAFPMSDVRAVHTNSDHRVVCSFGPQALARLPLLSQAQTFALCSNDHLIVAVIVPHSSA